MIVSTKHGDFECADITRKQRREFYKKVKKVFANKDITELHDLSDEFAVFAFNGEKNADEKLKGLSALEEDQVLTEIIGAYMGLDLGNITGD